LSPSSFRIGNGRFFRLHIVIPSIGKNTLRFVRVARAVSPDIAKRIVGVTADWREVEHLVSVVWGRTAVMLK